MYKYFARKQVVKMFLKGEVQYLRGLANKVLLISKMPDQNKKRKKWAIHNALMGKEYMAFVYPDGAWDELLPKSALQCKSKLGRSLEHQLLVKLIRNKYIPDDVPIDGNIKINKVIHNSMWGVQLMVTKQAEQSGAWHHDPIIEKPSDWKQLKQPEVEYDDVKTNKLYEASGDALSDILEPELVGVTNFSFHMMHWYCDYRGLNNMMMDLIDEPNMVQDTIRFFTEGVKSMLKQYEDLNLISLNNDDTFFYTGGLGYTDELPAAEFNPNRVRLCDVWAAAEAQEFSSISPAMHEEFILSYEREVLKPFGLTGHGCCDDLSKKLDGVLKINNIRRIAVCPWANISEFTPRLGRNYIMTWKPQPAFLANEVFDEQSVYDELKTGITKARGGVLELILRDTHTCHNDPNRFTKWVQLAYRAIQEIWVS